MSVIGKPGRLVVVALVCMTLIGCIGLIPSPFRPSPGPQKAPDTYDLAQAFDIVCRNYRVGPDDQLRVLYQTEWTIPPGSYQLDTLDELDIEFILDPSLNRKVSIRPDGNDYTSRSGRHQSSRPYSRSLG